MTYREIKKNKEINAYIKKGNDNLGVLGYTDHSQVHCSLVAERAALILEKCHSVEDIINLDTDINNRVSLISKFDPSYTQKYIRNNEQKPIFNRNYYRKT